MHSGKVGTCVGPDVGFEVMTRCESFAAAVVVAPCAVGKEKTM